MSSRLVFGRKFIICDIILSFRRVTSCVPDYCKIVQVMSNPVRLYTFLECCVPAICLSFHRDSCAIYSQHHSNHQAGSVKEIDVIVLFEFRFHCVVVPDSRASCYLLISAIFRSAGRTLPVSSRYISRLTHTTTNYCILGT